MYRKRPPHIVNRTIPKIIVISVDTVNRFPLTVSPLTSWVLIPLRQGVLDTTWIRYSTIETKEAARIGYNGFLFPHSYSLRTSAFTWVRMRKKRPVISNTGNLFCFNNNVSNLYNNSAIEKTNGTTFNPTTTLKLIYWSIIYPYVPINPIYFVNCYSKI